MTRGRRRGVLFCLVDIWYGRRSFLRSFSSPGATGRSADDETNEEAAKPSEILMAENYSRLEPWVYRPPSTDGLWMPDAFIRDTQMLTRALQTSIASSSSSSPSPSFSLPPTPTLTPWSRPCAKHEQSTSDSDSGSRRRTATVVVPGPTSKATKKRSRASKRSPTPTTFIAADPVSFRQMVQQVTGVSLGDEARPVDMVGATRPASRRSAIGGGSSGVVIPHGCLPTLDTSAFLLGRETHPPTVNTEDQSHDRQQNQQDLRVRGVVQRMYDYRR